MLTIYSPPSGCSTGVGHRGNIGTSRQIVLGSPDQEKNLYSVPSACPVGPADRTGVPQAKIPPGGAAGSFIHNFYVIYFTIYLLFFCSDNPDTLN
jgi:hypothetical protein